MGASSKAIRILERGFLFLGLLLLATFVFAHIHRFMMSRAKIAKFETRRLEAKNVSAATEGPSAASHNASLQEPQTVDYSLWSTRRTQFYRASIRDAVEPLAVLRIPALQLEAPVLEGTDEV